MTQGNTIKLTLISLALMCAPLAARATMFTGSDSEYLSATELNSIGWSYGNAYTSKFQYQSGGDLFLTSLALGSCTASLSSPFDLTTHQTYTTNFSCGHTTSTYGSVIPDLKVTSFTTSGSPTLTLSGSPSISTAPSNGYNQSFTAQVTLTNPDQPPPPPTAVPAPPGWLMMLTGLGILIPLYRRRVTQRKGVGSEDTLAL